MSSRRYPGGDDTEEIYALRRASRRARAGKTTVVSTTEPANPTEGLIWFNPNTGATKVWDGEFWRDVGGTGGGGGGTPHVVDPNPPSAPILDGTLWTNPDEDVPWQTHDHDSDYLPLAGGELTGDVLVRAAAGSLSVRDTNTTGQATVQMSGLGGGAAAFSLRDNDGTSVLNRMRITAEYTQFEKRVVSLGAIHPQDGGFDWLDSDGYPPSAVPPGITMETCSSGHSNYPGVYGMLITLADRPDIGRAMQMFMSRSGQGAVWMRGCNNVGTAWTDWVRVT